MTNEDNKMTNDISQTESRAVATVDGFVIPGTETITPQELQIPLLRIVQPTSRMENADLNGGMYHNSVTGEFVANPEVLVIGYAKGRVMFPREFSADNKPLCGSDNGVVPREEHIGSAMPDGTIIGELCHDCPFAQWQDNAPPACNEVNTFAGIDSDGMPVVFQAKSTGMKAARALKTMLKTSGINKTIRLGSVRTVNDSGTFYVPSYALGAAPDADWQASAVSVAGMGNLASREAQRASEYVDEPTGDDFPFGDDEFPDETELPF